MLFLKFDFHWWRGWWLQWYETLAPEQRFVLDMNMYMGNPLFEEWLLLSQIGNSSHLMSPEMAEWTRDDPWWFEMKLLDSTKDIYLKAKDDNLKNPSQFS